MNLTPQATNLSVTTVLNPHTESLRRENNQREVITQPAALAQSAAEKGVSSDKERGRTPAQNNANIDFASLREKAELANNSISEQNPEQNPEQNNDQQGSSAEQNEEQSADPTLQQGGGSSDSRLEEFHQARELRALQRRDQEVRSHELAHAAVGGAFTGTPNYSFETGPDGKKYAVEGEVSVDLSTIEGDPRATIAKMQKVHAAALAPADPSVQDTRIAATAAQIIVQAQSELLELQGIEFAQQKSSVKPAYINPNEVFETEGQSAEKDTVLAQEFDSFINQTLEAQEAIAPTQSTDVLQRAGRIESFYSKITSAYEKPASHQFELTA